MTSTPSPLPPRRTAVRRRRAIGCVAVLALAAGVAAGARAEGERRAVRPGVAELVVGDRTVARLPLRTHQRDGTLDAASVRRAVEHALPASLTVDQRRGRVTVQPEETATAARIVRAGIGGGRVRVAGRVVAATVRAPVVHQAQANTCESAALSVLLSALGRPADQNELQRALPTSGPADPVGTGPERIWGDPDRGYVGRPDGGGVAGGFGVYPAPVRATARRYGATLEDLSGQAPDAVYRRLREGRPVMVWVGLSDGPYGEWRSPDGKAISVNFGEHTVVLHGIRPDGSLLVSNPLEGTREVWTRQQFETMFARLGRRALAG